MRPPAIRSSWRGLLGLAAALALPACGQQPLSTAAVGQHGAAEDPFGAQGTGASIQVFFNATYGETIRANEPIARRSPINTDKGLLALIRSARESLDGALTDREVGDVLAEKQRAGLNIGGVFDRWLAAGPYSLFLPFKAEGQTVYKDGNEALMHHKVFVIDGTTVITGSYNNSQNAELANNESFVIVRRSPGLARAYEGEFERVLHAARVNHPPPVKPRDSEQEIPDPDKI